MNASCISPEKIYILTWIWQFETVRSVTVGTRSFLNSLPYYEITAAEQAVNGAPSRHTLRQLLRWSMRPFMKWTSQSAVYWTLSGRLHSLKSLTRPRQILTFQISPISQLYHQASPSLTKPHHASSAQCRFDKSLISQKFGKFSLIFGCISTDSCKSACILENITIDFLKFGKSCS